MLDKNFKGHNWSNMLKQFWISLHTQTQIDKVAKVRCGEEILIWGANYNLTYQ